MVVLLLKMFWVLMLDVFMIFVILMGWCGCVVMDVVMLGWCWVVLDGGVGCFVWGNILFGII